MQRWEIQGHAQCFTRRDNRVGSAIGPCDRERVVGHRPAPSKPGPSHGDRGQDLNDRVVRLVPGGIWDGDAEDNVMVVGIRGEGYARDRI